MPRNFPWLIFTITIDSDELKIIICPLSTNLFFTIQFIYNASPRGLSSEPYGCRWTNEVKLSILIRQAHVWRGLLIGKIRLLLFTASALGSEGPCTLEYQNLI